MGPAPSGAKDAGTTNLCWHNPPQHDQVWLGSQPWAGPVSMTWPRSSKPTRGMPGDTDTGGSPVTVGQRRPAFCPHGGAAGARQRPGSFLLCKSSEFHTNEESERIRMHSSLLSIPGLFRFPRPPATWKQVWARLRMSGKWLVVISSWFRHLLPRALPDVCEIQACLMGLRAAASFLEVF